MPVKMEDVARAAGVSTATVSRALNTPELVSERTRQRVLDAIEQLDYKINLAARNLRTNQTRTLAIVIPSISEPVINQVVEAVEDIAISEQYSLLLCRWASPRMPFRCVGVRSSRSQGELPPMSDVTDTWWWPGGEPLGTLL